MASRAVVQQPHWSSKHTTEEDRVRLEEFVVVDRELLKALLALSKKLGENRIAGWSLVGDLGEQLLNVNVPARDISILVERDAFERVIETLRDFNPTRPKEMEQRLPREAIVEKKRHPVFIRSYKSVVNISGKTINILSQLQIKIGNMEWGDVLVFEPAEVNLVGERIRVMPLQLKSELYFSLGWYERVGKIALALFRSQHHAMRREVRKKN